jgi:hypothetical protein
MSNYNLTTEQLNLLRNVFKLSIMKDRIKYKLSQYLIFTNEVGDKIQINSTDVNNMLHSTLLNSETSDMNTEQRAVGSSNSLTSDIFTKPATNQNMNTDSDVTSTMNTQQMNGAELSTTSDDIKQPKNQQGGKYNNNDITSSINPNMFNNVNMSTTSDVAITQNGGSRNDFSSDNTAMVGTKLFNESSIMSSSLDLSEISGMSGISGMRPSKKNNKNTRQVSMKGGYNKDFSSDNTAMVGSKLFNESSVMSSSLDLSEMTNTRPSKKNNNIFNTNQVSMKGGHDTSKDETLRMIKQKLQELQSSTIGMSIQNELSYEHHVERIQSAQAGGFTNLLGKSNSYQASNKKLSSKILKEIGINSSSTSEFCD